jgi:hypothetical protein
MDPNTQPIGGQVPGVQPSASQPQYAPAQYPQMLPMPDGWAPGVSPVTVVPSRSHRGRWAIAGAVVLIVALLTAGGAFVLAGAGGQKSLTAGVAPKNAIAFLETRVDLPGDQHAKLADFMSHFPGFQDRAQFNTALDELLSRLTFAGANLSYTTDFKPWMQGEVSVALVNEGPNASTGVVVIFAVKDRAGAEKWAASQLARAGTSFTNEDYAGTKIYATGAGMNDEAYAVTDQDLFIGTTPGVKSALDSKANGSLADNAKYQAAMKSLSGDSLARLFVDTGSIASLTSVSAMGAMASFGGMMQAGAPSVLSTMDVPAWIAGSIRAESDRAVVTITMPRTAASNLGIANHSSTLASRLPGSTVAVSETHSIGKIIGGVIPMLQSQSGMTASGEMAQVTGVLSKIGGTDWIGDGAEVLTKDGSTYGGGIVVEAPDSAAAAVKESSITNLVALAGATLQVTSRDEAYKGVTVTLITVPADVTGGMPIEIAVAAKDNLIVAGYTDAFVKAVIDTTPSNSLASQADYSNVMAQAGSSNEQSFYVNVPAVEDQIGQMYSPARWASDYKPYFDHLGGVAGSVIDGDTVTLRIVISAR